MPWQLVVALCLFGSAALAGDSFETASVAGLPGPLLWKNTPVAWHAGGTALQIEAGKSTDWYISPVDGKQFGNAPVLLFAPAREFVLSAKVKVDFRTKWDAGALFVYIDDKTWAKFAFEMSVYRKPTVVTVVTRGVSDDCNSWEISGNEVWLRVARLGDAIGFYASHDGSQWEMIRAFTFGPSPKLNMGFSSQSPAGAGTQAVFSEIHYAARKITDIFVGE